jgi:methionine sulfoxide reductase catalytic subunit
MTNTHLTPLTHDPIEADLSPADDRVLLNDWLPPKVGVVPKLRIGWHWFNVLWALPIGFVLAVIGVDARRRPIN